MKFLKKLAMKCFDLQEIDRQCHDGKVDVMKHLEYGEVEFNVDGGHHMLYWLKIQLDNPEARVELRRKVLEVRHVPLGKKGKTSTEELNYIVTIQNKFDEIRN